MTLSFNECDHLVVGSGPGRSIPWLAPVYLLTGRRREWR
jgi:hypothetical protein